MHETNKKPMKGWVKLLVTFLGGALIATLVILTTSGVFFTGALIKGGGYMDPGTLSICDSTCTLTTKLKNLTSSFNSFVTEYRNANYTNQLNGLRSSLQNFHEEYWNANYSGQLNSIRATIQGFKEEYWSANYSGQINGLNQMYNTLAGALTAHTTAHNAGNYPPIYPY